MMRRRGVPSTRRRPTRVRSDPFPFAAGNPADQTETIQHEISTVIDRIRNGGYGRSDLIKLHSNAKAMQAKGDADAAAVFTELGIATPFDKAIIFMGFCPGADFARRLDKEWKRKGICEFKWRESKAQHDRFCEIWPGDLIVLKKREQFGKTMRLYGHGRVAGVKHDVDDDRYLLMDWSDQNQVIEVPLMGCNSTVEVRTIEQVEEAMPAAFFDWLGR